jgi:hypothetical protein
MQDRPPRRRGSDHDRDDRLEERGGHPHAFRTQRAHEARASTSHGPRACGSTVGAPNGPSLQAPSRRPARPPRHRLFGAPARSIRTRLLLARPRTLSRSTMEPRRERGERSRCALARHAPCPPGSLQRQIRRSVSERWPAYAGSRMGRSASVRGRGRARSERRGRLNQRVAGRYFRLVLVRPTAASCGTPPPPRRAPAYAGPPAPSGRSPRPRGW